MGTAVKAALGWNATDPVDGRVLAAMARPAVGTCWSAPWVQNAPALGQLGCWAPSTSFITWSWDRSSWFWRIVVPLPAWGTRPAPGLIGFLYAALGVARLIAGPVTEKLGARRTLVLAGLLLSASVLVTTSLQLVGMLLLGTSLMGLASALLWSAGGAMALAVSQANRRGAAAGRLYVFTGMGLLLGALTVDFFLPSIGRFTSPGFVWLQGLWLAAGVAVTLAALLLPIAGKRRRAAGASAGRTAAALARGRQPRLRGPGGRRDQLWGLLQPGHQGHRRGAGGWPIIWAKCRCRSTRSWPSPA